MNFDFYWMIGIICTILYYLRCTKNVLFVTVAKVREEIEAKIEEEVKGRIDSQYLVLDNVFLSDYYI